MRNIIDVKSFTLASVFLLARESCFGAEIAIKKEKLAHKIATLVGLPFYGVSGSTRGEIPIDESSENICYLLERAARIGLMIPNLAGVSREYLEFSMVKQEDLMECGAFSGGVIVSGVIAQRGDSLEVSVIYNSNADKIESVSLVGKDRKLMATDLQKTGVYAKKGIKISEIESLSVVFSSGYIDGIVFQIDESGKVIDEEKVSKIVRVSASMGADNGLTIEISKIIPSKHKDVSVAQFFAVGAEGNGSGYESSLNGNNESPLASISFSSQNLKSFKIATCRIALDYSKSPFTVPCKLYHGSGQ